MSDIIGGIDVLLERMSNEDPAASEPLGKLRSNLEVSRSEYFPSTRYYGADHPSFLFTLPYVMSCVRKATRYRDSCSLEANMPG